MDHLQPLVLNQPLHTQAFFTLVDTTASLVSVSDKYWQSKGLNGARIRILVEISKQGGTILPSTLAHNIGVTKANISLLLIPWRKMVGLPARTILRMVERALFQLRVKDNDYFWSIFPEIVKRSLNVCRVWINKSFGNSSFY